MDDDTTGELTKTPPETTEEYYLSAFKKLENSGENTWNWAAFFFGPLWSYYRKMGFIGIFFLFCYFICLVLFLEAHLFDIERTWKTETLAITFPMVLWGIFGNKIYYWQVKQNIKAGCRLRKNYSPTLEPIYFIYWSVLFILRVHPIFWNRLAPDAH
ncbi:hypothetical protein FACS1894126_3310 [Alphaproteobacteria bacterium]|nr:hypothetical protein FACS1894126_3310 [Alphaproteobacteria bacterium]